MFDKNALENAVVEGCTTAAAAAVDLTPLQRAKFIVAATEALVIAIMALPIAMPAPPAPKAAAPRVRKPRGPNKAKLPPIVAITPAGTVTGNGADPAAAAALPPVPPAPGSAAPTPFGS